MALQKGRPPREKRQWEQQKDAFHSNTRAYQGDAVAGQDGGILQRVVDGDEVVQGHGPEHPGVHDGEAVDEEHLAEASVKADLLHTEEEDAQHGGEGGEGHPQLAHRQHGEEEVHGFV